MDAPPAQENCAPFVQVAGMMAEAGLNVPRVLDWVTGSIGFHHVHHLSPRIPLYNLRRCHRELALFGAAHVLTLRESLRTFRLKLWDEDAGRLVTFREARLAHA